MPHRLEGDPTEDRQEARRSEDRDRPLIQRLDQLDRLFNELNLTVGVMKVESKAAADLTASRYQVLEKVQAIQDTKLDSITREITNFGSMIQTLSGDPDKTPAGRQILYSLNSLRRQVDGLDDLVNQVVQWRNQITGGFLFFKLLSGLGGLSFLLVVLRMLSLIP